MTACAMPPVYQLAAFLRTRCQDQKRTTPTPLNLLALPVSTPEQQYPRKRNRALRHDDRCVRSRLVHSGAQREKIRQRDLQQPEAEEIHNRRSHRVSRSIEGLQHHHTVGISYVAVTQ